MSLLRSTALLLAATLLLPAATPHAAVPRILESVHGLQWETITFNATLHENIRLVSTHCTIFNINRKRQLWATAAHCVTYDDSTPVDYPFWISGHDATVVKVDVDKDIAVLQTKTFPTPSLPVTRRSPPHLSPITIAGFPFGYGPILLTGHLSADAVRVGTSDARYIIYAAPTCPSLSGSPIVNEHGEVISMVQFAFDVQEGCSPLGGGPSTSVLYQALKEYL